MPDDNLFAMWEVAQCSLEATMADKAPWAHDIGPNINNHASILLANVRDLLRSFLDDLARSLDRFLGLSGCYINLSFGSKFLASG
jgi:hypothetical protein